jgi:hypothetical protein
VFDDGELAATLDHMRERPYMTHGMSFFCRFNVTYPRSSKQKRWLAALKLGFDRLDLMKYGGYGKVWGERMIAAVAEVGKRGSSRFVIHDFMSLQTFNRKVCQFLTAVRDTREDPYQ